MTDLEAAELEHVIGFSGQELHSLVFHPLDANIFLHGIGHVVVVADQVQNIEPLTPPEFFPSQFLAGLAELRG